MTDNGREFLKENRRNLTDAWNIVIVTTAAECPFSNGRFERTVGLIKDGLRKLKEGGVECKKGIILFWIVMAKKKKKKTRYRWWEDGGVCMIA